MVKFPPAAACEKQTRAVHRGKLSRVAELQSDLMVWRKAHEFVLAVYRFTSTFPKSEIRGLAQQMRRATVSIPANIAEDKARFMNIAESSLEESRYYLILSQDLGYGQTDVLMNALEDVSRPLTATKEPFWLLAPGFRIPLLFSGISRA